MNSSQFIIFHVAVHFIEKVIYPSASCSSRYICCSGFMSDSNLSKYLLNIYNTQNLILSSQNARIRSNAILLLCMEILLDLSKIQAFEVNVGIITLMFFGFHRD